MPEAAVYLAVAKNFKIMLFALVNHKLKITIFHRRQCGLMSNSFLGIHCYSCFHALYPTLLACIANALEYRILARNSVRLGSKSFVH